MTMVQNLKRLYQDLHKFGIKINRTKLLNEFENNVESIYKNFLQGKKSYEYTKTENHLVTYNYKQ